MDEKKQELIEAIKLTVDDPNPVPEHAPFRSNWKELLAALASYYLGWIYLDAVTDIFDYNYLYLILFAGLFSLGAMVLYRENLRKKEHWIWLGCLWLCIVSQALGRNRVWGQNYLLLFIHGYAIYWVLCISGKLVAGESGGYLVMDAINGLIVFPLKHFFCFLRTRVLLWGIRQLRPRNGKKIPGLGYILTAAVIALLLLIGAGNLLVSADANFGTLLRKLIPDISLGGFTRHLPRFFFLSMPVGAYLYGLVVGTGREKQETLENEKKEINSFLESLRKVPPGAWTVLMGAFVVFYLLFFGVQGSYLFGAFVRNLPEGFTVAEYARQGFFELCGILTLNFALLWMVLYSSTSPVREKKAAKGMATALLAESFMFAVTAMSKLVLYISCFGFTPLRLQSFWGVTVLMAGCVCCLVSLWSGKKTWKYWIYITGISLALLHLY